MMHHEIIRQYIIDNFLFEENENLRIDTSFLDNGIIDSTGILELAQFVEETFNITIHDEEFTPENLDSLMNIDQFIQRKQQLILSQTALTHFSAN